MKTTTALKVVLLGLFLFLIAAAGILFFWDTSETFSAYMESQGVDFVVFTPEYGNFFKIDTDGDRTPISPEEAVDFAIENPHRLADAGTVDCLKEYLWHNQNLDDPPGSYNRMIVLERRGIDIDPGYKERYFNVAWLLFSQWCMWNENPEQMPDGEYKIEEAMAVLAKGAEEFLDSAEYHFTAAMTIDPLMRYDLPENNAFAQENLIKADALAGEGEEELRIRTRLRLGIMFSRRGMEDEAKKWFVKTLEIDPHNKPSLRYLEELE